MRVFRSFGVNWAMKVKLMTPTSDRESRRSNPCVVLQSILKLEERKAWVKQLDTEAVNNAASYYQDC